MDTDAAVETAQSGESFDVLAFIEQTAYPTSTVTLFKDAKSADEYVKLVARRAEQEGVDGVFEDLDPQIEELGNKIRESAMVFELRGIAPGIVKLIMTAPEGETEEESVEADFKRDNDLVAKTIISVSNHRGVKDTHAWTADEVAKLRVFLKEGEFSKLLEGVAAVNFNAAIFDQATDAGFSGRSSDVA